MTLPLLIDQRLSTAAYWMPLRSSWVEERADVTLIENPVPDAVARHQGIAIVDSVLATKFLTDRQIIAGHGVSWTQISLLTLVSDARPDELDDAIVRADGISLTGHAIAEIVIPSFYAIKITGWATGPDHQAAVEVTEDERALQVTAGEEAYYEDLGRAWYLLTDTPFVSHVCLVPRAVAASQLDDVIATSEWLEEILQAGHSHAREMRRNISKDFDVDRELAADILAGQSSRIGEREIDGLRTLYRRVGARLDPRQTEPLIVRS